MASLTFLGTGGGRYVILSQRRHSGGIWLDLGKRIIVDPGPGALVRAIEERKDPMKLDAVLVSHNHLDHYNDAEVMIEAMTHGLKRRRGFFAAPKSALAYISEYHRESADVRSIKAGDVLSIGDVKIEALPTVGHADGIGFRFKTGDSDIVYSSDTGFSQELASSYRGAKTLILNVIFPSGKPIKSHLNTDSAIEVVRMAKPKLCIITHFGTTMLNADPDKQAARIQAETGIKTIAAADGMTIDLKHPTEEQRRLEGF